jgi:hypothetical protein
MTIHSKKRTATKRTQHATYENMVRESNTYFHFDIEGLQLLQLHYQPCAWNSHGFLTDLNQETVLVQALVCKVIQHQQDEDASGREVRKD